MRSGIVRGIVTGTFIGAAALIAYDMVNPRAARQMGRMVRKSGYTLYNKAANAVGKGKW